MRAVIPIFFILILASSVRAQKVYQLVSKTDSGDFNYKALRAIDTFSNPGEAFVPVRGSFTVYTLIATFQGLSHRDDKQHDFHDILIIKTTKDSLIKDAFQFTLEWAEEPLSYDLFRSDIPGLLISNGLPIKRLELKRVESYDNADVKKEEEGVINLK